MRNCLAFKNGDSEMALATLPDEQRGEELVALNGSTNYLDFLSNLASESGAQTYLEIGTQAGSSLARIDCPSIAVDPSLSLSVEVVGKKPICMLFQMTSDDFFKRYDPVRLLGRRLDVAFLDGMHLYEFLLRDLINTDKYCQRGSVIALHDCITPTFEMTSRECRGATLNRKYLNYWTGDVWKIIPILKAYRPDMEVQYVDCPPTGLVILTRLDPSSNVLAANYDTIVSEFRERGDDLP